MKRTRNLVLTLGFTSVTAGCTNEPVKQVPNVEKISCELSRECDERYKRTMSWLQMIHTGGGHSHALEVVKNAPKIFKPTSIPRAGFGSVARGIGVSTSGS